MHVITNLIKWTNDRLNAVNMECHVDNSRFLFKFNVFYVFQNKKKKNLESNVLLIFFLVSLFQTMKRLKLACVNTEKVFKPYHT